MMLLVMERKIKSESEQPIKPTIIRHLLYQLMEKQPLKNTRFCNGKYLYIENVFISLCNGDGPVCALLKYKTEVQKGPDFTGDYGRIRRPSHRGTNLNGNKIMITESIVSYSLGINAINFTYEYVNAGLFDKADGSYEEIYSADEAADISQ